MEANEKKIGTWFGRKRIVMCDPLTQEEDWSVHISRLGLVGSVAAFVLVLLVLVLVLVAYTPILDLFPGYRTAAERQHDELVQSVMRIDSLERRMNDMLTYNENIAMILEGRTPVVRTPLSDGDAATLDKTLVSPSEFDSLLRLQMEGDGDYSLARTLRSREQGGRLMFAAPVEGIITRHFSRDDNYLGVGIQSAPNSPITSIDDGAVVDVVMGGEQGATVTVQHFNGYISVYRNLSQVLVSKAQVLKSRQVIGYNAMRDNESRQNPLVEIEIWTEGKAVDPENYIVF